MAQNVGIQIKLAEASAAVQALADALTELPGETLLPNGASLRLKADMLERLTVDVQAMIEFHTRPDAPAPSVNGGPRF